MKLFIISFFVIVFYSCSVDYVPNIKTSSECIIVNSLLQPDSTITIRLYAINIINNQTKVVPLQNANIILKEGESFLYNNKIDSILKLDLYPKIGETYSLEVSHDEYSTIRAKTTIPYSAKCNIGSNGFYTLSDFEFSEVKSPLWITISACFSNNLITQFSELYCSNLLIDNFNREEGSEIFSEKIGSGYHNSFLRIKEKNLIRLDSICVLPMFNRSFIIDEYIGDEIRIITASKEYDQYCKTYYEQLNSPIDDDAASLFYQPTNVFSNVENGVGIFAGKNETVYFIKRSI